MLELMEESNAKRICIRATEKLTTDDYQKGFMPKLDEALGKGKKINALFFLDGKFTGWDLGAAWEDAKFGMKHRNDFNKLAVVGGPDYIKWGFKLSTFLMDCEIQTYSENELEKALAWVDQ